MHPMCFVIRLMGFMDVLKLIIHVELNEKIMNLYHKHEQFLDTYKYLVHDNCQYCAFIASYRVCSTFDVKYWLNQPFASYVHI